MAVSGYRKFRAEGNILRGACINVVAWTPGRQIAYCVVAGFDTWGTPKGAQIAQSHLRGGVCACGLNAYKDRDYKQAELWSLSFPNDVTAAVTMWGWVIEYTDGYRAEYMQIDHLWLDGPASFEKQTQAAALTAHYGVGCDIASPMEYEWSDSGCEVVFCRKELIT